MEEDKSGRGRVQREKPQSHTDFPSGVPGLNVATGKITSKVTDKALAVVAGKVAATVGTAAAGPVGTVVAIFGKKVVVAAIIKTKKYTGRIAQGAIVFSTIIIAGISGMALGAVLAVVGAAIGTILLIVLIAFMVNSGAYIVPGGFQGTTNIDIPEGCPAPVWPVDLTRGQHYRMSQGPGGTASHNSPYYAFGVEAIDINPEPRQTSVNEAINSGRDLVVATHPGTITFAQKDNNGGLSVSIKATCSDEVVTWYVHMWNLKVKVGDQVRAGTVLGTVGCTGFCGYSDTNGSGILGDCVAGVCDVGHSPGAAHVHYEFRNTNPPGPKNRQRHGPPYMMIPYIPQTPRYGCTTYAGCNINIP